VGYNVEMSLSNVVIPVGKIDRALKAINDLFKPEKLKKGSGTSWAGDVETRHYCWVNTPSEPFTDIVAALAEWRYQAGWIGPGDLVVKYFTGEKLGDDSILWTALAPFIRPGAEITFQGEDGIMWKWVFDGKEFREKYGRVVFEDAEPVKKESPKPKSTVKRPGLGLDGPRRI